MLTKLSKHALLTQLGNEIHFLSPDFHLSGLLYEITKQDLSFDESSLMTVDSMLLEGKPYRVVDGMAIIPVHGYLSHRDSFHIPNYFTGYRYIDALLTEAMSDTSVKGVVLDVNSPGGTVAGAFETTAVIRDVASVKPVAAIVDSSSYSAGYLLSSAASKIYVPEAGGVGSIGVVTMHVDVSKALDDYGFKVTMLYAGDYKVDGNPYEPLSEGARQRIQSRLEQSYDMFVSTVAMNRGLAANVVKDTNAGLFQGASAVSVGLADAVMSPSEAYAAFIGQISNKSEVKIMAAEQVQVATAQATEQPSYTEVMASERTRINTILKCDEAEGRSDLANYIAFETSMSVEEAKKMLAVSPVAVAAADSNPFLDAMNNGENPGIGAEGGDLDTGMTTSQQIVADWKKETGRK